MPRCFPFHRCREFCRGPTAPFTIAKFSTPFESTACCPQHKQNSEVGCCIGEDIWRVGCDKASLLGGSGVDVFVADGEGRDRFDGWCQTFDDFGEKSSVLQVNIASTPLPFD